MLYCDFLIVNGITCTLNTLQSFKIFPSLRLCHGVLAHSILSRLIINCTSKSEQGSNRAFYVRNQLIISSIYYLSRGYQKYYGQALWPNIPQKKKQLSLFIYIRKSSRFYEVFKPFSNSNLLSIFSQTNEQLPKIKVQR